MPIGTLTFVVSAWIVGLCLCEFYANLSVISSAMRVNCSMINSQWWHLIVDSIGSHDHKNDCEDYVDKIT